MDIAVYILWILRFVGFGRELAISSLEDLQGTK
jgi:hypothetical protein